MNIKSVILSLFIIVSFVGINSLGRFYINEPLVRGQDFEMISVVRNPTNHDLDDVNMKLYIYDLGIRLTSNDFDLNDGGHTTARIDWIIPTKIRTGTYLSKISVSNDHYSDSQYIYLTIV